MITWNIRDEYIELNVIGKLTDSHYREILPVLNHILATRQKPKFLIVLDRFEGWELSALWTDLRYDLKHGKEFGPMAVIGETATAKWLTQFSNIFFPSEILFFGKDEENVARTWLPMTEKLVAREFLEQAIRTFVVGNLPSQGNLNLYGMEFPDFIRTYEPAKHLPYLHDFTRLEWLWEAAYYAPDDLPLDAAELMSISEEDMPNLQFSFRKSFALLESEYPLDEIVDFCRAEDQDDLHALSNRGCKLMIYRPDLKVELRRLDDAEHLFLSTLRDEQTIHETAEILAAHYPDVDLIPLLQKHLQLGTFTSVEIRR